MFENKKIYILGMAKSGYEAAKLLSQYHNDILITDGKEQDEDQVRELEELGVQVIITQNQAKYLHAGFDYVVKNPGVRYDCECVLKAQELGIPVVNEVEVAYHFLPKGCNIIGITGSNGKTTTTTLIYEMFQHAGRKVHLGGNIGYPLCSLVDKVRSGDTVVLEVSAQQLHDMHDFKMNYSVLTNLSEVHLDFFGTFDYYKENKKRIFQNQGVSEYAIINVGDEEVVRLTQDLDGNKIGFSSKGEADACIIDGFISYHGKKIIALDDIRVKGMHNYENIMGAMIVALENGIDVGIICEVLNDFAGVEHRIEFVKRLNGREFYNDSKATNVKSTQIALSSFEQPVILLLGGYDRGHSFDGLKEYMGHVKEIVCYGATKERILEFALAVSVRCEVVETLEEAIRVAYVASADGDVILLSPACASWDQYRCFEDRGDEFKAVVETLE